jgi:prevent-host-death family protein
MRQLKASEFKARCLQVMDEVAETGEPVLITKNGRPVAQLGPVADRSRSLIGLHRGGVELYDDLIAPVSEPWEADR